MERLNSNTTTRQMVIFFALLKPMTKLIVLPSMIFFLANRDAPIVVLVIGLLDLAGLAAILHVIKTDNRGLFEILEDAFGLPFAKAFAIVLFIYFIFRSILPVFEDNLLAFSVLYETNPKPIFFLPLFIAIFYAAVKGFNGIFRSMELFGAFFAISLLGLFALGANSAKFSEVLPLFEYGLTPSFKAIYQYCLWFGDYTCLFLLMNNMKLKKGDSGKLFLSYSIGFFITVAFFFLVAGIFGNTAPRQIYMLAKISKYSIAFSNLGRIDFLFIVVIFMGMLLYNCLFATAAVKCLTYATKLRPTYTSMITAGILLMISTLFIQKFATISGFITHFISPFMIFIQYIFPFFLPLIAKLSRKPKEALA